MGLFAQHSHIAFAGGPDAAVLESEEQEHAKTSAAPSAQCNMAHAILARSRTASNRNVVKMATSGALEPVGLHRGKGPRE
jgi:hypothetical protein